MEGLKQHPLLQGRNSLIRGWTSCISATGSLVRKIHLALGRKGIIILTATLLTFGTIIAEIQTSFIEALFFPRIAQLSSFKIQTGAASSIRFPTHGPYDQRLGYARLPDFIKNLNDRSYRVEAQAQASWSLSAMTVLGLTPPYSEKNQAGLTVLAQEGKPLFKARYPQRICPPFASLSPLIVDTLLFIENRELLDSGYANRNPAIEWDRFAKAFLDRGIHVLNPQHSYAGGSTLATQLEKFRHSPDGRTPGGWEKIRQILSASLRAYRNGPNTEPMRRQLIVDYLNSVPFAAFPKYGEVLGIGDALWTFYGANFNTVNTLLEAGEDRAADMKKAEAYKQVLSLFIAQRRPSYYLVTHRDVLEKDTDAHLRVLCKAGVITPALRDSALRIRLKFLENQQEVPAVSFVNRKAANAIRRELLSVLNLPRLYDLDRLDLSVKSTLNGKTQNNVNHFFGRLQDPTYTRASGLHGSHLLGNKDPGRLTYSFTLYEHVGQANLVRLQTDNFNQPFDVNEGLKMELGSTAKLRTLATYLEIIADLHERYSGLPSDLLRTLQADPRDRLAQWAINYLIRTDDRSLHTMLEAAMERRYSANPKEFFFTGGGQHLFRNFDEEDDFKIPSVREGFEKSINLVFIRLMRDIVYSTICRQAGPMTKILENAQDPSRPVLLARFADQEGRVFINRFYNKYRGKTPDEQLHLILQGLRPTPSRLAAVFRYVNPTAGKDELRLFLKSHRPDLSLSERDVEKWYQYYQPQKWNLQDWGYITRLHPLELWLVAYLRTFPDAKRTSVLEASVDQRQEIYQWLFKPHRKSSQDSRIRMMLEADAFKDISRRWKTMGYPFDSLVPSYATAIGSSADRPASLAELVGIILNHGIRYPVVRMDELHFASGTPYETLLQRQEVPGSRVLAPEIASVLRGALIDTVEKGTARQLYKAFLTEDRVPLEVGGKTGTGDNRYETVDRNGQIIESRILNRAAVFVFFIGDRFFGTITAYVEGPEAAGYDFTSSLPVRILKLMAPQLMPLIEKPDKKQSTREALTPIFLSEENKDHDWLNVTGIKNLP